MSRTAVRAAAGLLAAAALTLTACSPVTTDKPYSASDGVRLRWSDTSLVKGENLLLLTSAEGEDARLVGGLSNDTGEDVEIELGFAGGETTVVEVPAHTTVLLDGSRERDVVLSDIPVPPGATAEMTFASPSLGTITQQIPVLDGTFEEYAALVP